MSSVDWPDLPIVGGPDPQSEQLPGTVSVRDMAVGDCFDLATAHDMTIVVPSPCAVEHFGQVLVQTQLDPGPYTALSYTNTSGCSALWPASAAQRLAAGDIRESNQVPSAKEWAADDRMLVCTAVTDQHDRPLTASLIS